MAILKSQMDTGSNGFRENRRYNLELRNRLQEALARVAEGGGERVWQRLRAQGKIEPRARIKKVLDPTSPFLELSPLAGWEMYDGACPGGGLVTGIGLVAGRPVMFVANDPSVKGGSYFPVTIKKHLRAQEVAQENRLPCAYLVDSGGAYLPLQSEVFPDRDHFGRIFYNMARMSAEGIPQIAAVLGLCTAGGAYVPAMADEVVMVDGNASIFLGGPPLVKAATGEEVSAEELGGSRVHTEVSGVADYRAADESSALQKLREILASLPASPPRVPPEEPSEPLYDPEELYGLLPADPRQPFEMREVLARILDGSDLVEFKPNYGETLICGFSRIMGFPVGLLANNGPLTCEAAQKGTHFIQMADQRRLPLVFFQAVTGFMVGREHEHRGIAKEGAKMVRAVANATVPKLTVVVAGSHGAGNYAMCGRAYSPRFLWTWPSARISVMSGAAASSVLKQLARRKGGREEDARLDRLIAQYEKESSAFYATARLWDDGILDPMQTRATIGLALSIVRPEPATGRYGIFRM